MSTQQAYIDLDTPDSKLEDIQSFASRHEMMMDELNPGPTPGVPAYRYTGTREDIITMVQYYFNDGPYDPSFILEDIHNIGMANFFDFLESIPKHNNTCIVHTYIQDNSTGAPMPDPEDYTLPLNDKRVKTGQKLGGFMGMVIGQYNELDMFIWFPIIEDRDAWLAGKRINPRLARAI